MTRTAFEDDLASRLRALADLAPVVEIDDLPVVTRPRPGHRRWPVVAAAAAALALIGGVVATIDRQSHVSTGDVGAAGATPDRPAWLGDGWQELDDGLAMVDESHPLAAVSGDRLLVWLESTNANLVAPASAIDLRTGEMSRLPDGAVFSSDQFVSLPREAAWLGDELYVCCDQLAPAFGSGGSGHAIRRVGPDGSDRGSVLLPVGWSSSGVAASTVAVYVVTSEGAVVSYEPGTETIATLAQLPTAPGPSPNVVWAGDRLVVVPSDGLRPFPGLVFDPASNEWSDLPDWPSGDLYPEAAVWTGHEVLMWGWLPGVAGAYEVMAWTPGSPQWREVVAGHLQGNGDDAIDPGSTSAVWTGSAMVVYAADSSFVAPPESTEILMVEPTSDTGDKNSLGRLPGVEHQPRMFVIDDILIVVGEDQVWARWIGGGRRVAGTRHPRRRGGRVAARVRSRGADQPPGLDAVGPGRRRRGRGLDRMHPAVGGCGQRAVCPAGGDHRRGAAPSARGVRPPLARPDRRRSPASRSERRVRAARVPPG